MPFVEDITKRTSHTVVSRDSEFPQVHRMVASLVPVHYSDMNGDFQRIDMSPVRINPGDWSRYPNFDGWLVSQNGWLYGLGVDGYVYFGGRRGQHYVRFRLREVGYVQTTTGAFTAISGLPTYNTANLSRQQTQVNIEGETYVTGTTAEWHNLLSAGGGELFLRFRARGDGLKAEYVITQAAREWIVANRPPSFYGIPAAQAYLAFRFDLDFSDIPRKLVNGVLQGDTFDDANGGVELRNTLDELLAFMPIGDAYVDTGEELFRSKVTLRKRFAGGLMTVGAAVSALNALPAGDLVFDPTITPSVGTGADDGSWITATAFDSTIVEHVAGRYASYDAHSFYRYTGIAIPKDSLVSAAYLTVTAYVTTAGASPTLQLRMIDADNQAAPTNQTEAENMVETTAVTTWNTVPAWTGGVAYNTADFAASAEEVFARTLWASGNAVVVQIYSTTGSGSNYRDIASENHATYPAPMLTVTYTVPGVTVSPTAVEVTASVVSPTVIKGSLSITPAVRSMTASQVDPDVVQSSIGVAPTAQGATFNQVEPDVLQGSLAITPGAQSGSLSLVAPDVIQGSVAVTPDAQNLTATAQAPGVILGAMSLSPTAQSFASSAVDPDVVQGGLTLVPDTAVGVFSLGNVTVILSSLSLLPDAQGAAFSQVDPDVVQGALVIAPAAVTATFALQSPDVLQSSLVVTVAAVGAVFSVVSPSVNAGGNIEVSPTSQGATFSLIAPDVIQGSIGVTPAAQGITFSRVDPDAIQGSLAIAPSAVEAVFSLVAPDVIVPTGVVVTPDVVGAILAAGSNHLVTVGSLAVTPVAVTMSATITNPTIVVTLSNPVRFATMSINDAAGGVLTITTVTSDMVIADAANAEVEIT